MQRRSCFAAPWALALFALAHGGPALAATDADPYLSAPWVDMKRVFLGDGKAVFDERVQVQGPAFAEDPMNVPISVRVDPSLGPIEQIVVMVDRNPIRKVLVYCPMQALPSLTFRFKLEQASPVRAAALAKSGVWHVGGAWVDSSGGGCTVAGVTRKDGTWSQTLGDVSGRLFSVAPGSDAASRLRYGEQLRALIKRTTPQPVVKLLHLNLHPDYFLGNQAFADVPRAATPATRAGMAREASSYVDNLYRVCGEWEKGTEALLPDRDVDVAAGGGRWKLGEREFEWREFNGHTASDLVLIDRSSGVAFVGGHVFKERILTTPHAAVGPWLDSLDRLAALKPRTVVPSHGPVHADGSGIDQTRRYLQWLDRSFSGWAAQGWDMNEVLRGPLPAEFRGWAAFGTEYVRNVAHLYPVYERAALPAGQPLPGARR